MRIVLALILFVSAASAQQVDQARTAGAVPTLIQQRNGALDALAVCNGDLQTLQEKLKAANAELEKLKKDK